MEATTKREKVRRLKWDVFAPPDWHARDAARLSATTDFGAEQPLAVPAPALRKSNVR